jgi:hypothetical protein
MTRGRFVGGTVDGVASTGVAAMAKLAAAKERRVKLMSQD